MQQNLFDVALSVHSSNSSLPLHIYLWSVLESCSPTVLSNNLISLFLLSSSLHVVSLFAVWRVQVLLKVRETLNFVCFSSCVLSLSDFQPIKPSMMSTCGIQCILQNNLRLQNLFGWGLCSMKQNNIVDGEQRNTIDTSPAALPCQCHNHRCTELNQQSKGPL